MAIALLERLITKAMQKVMDIAEKVMGNAVSAVKEASKKTENPIHEEAKPIIQLERPPQPKPSVLVKKYPRLKEIDGRLKEQNKAIFGREKKKDKLKKELSECTGIFKGGRRKELQQEIDSLDFQISNMKKRLSSIVKEYKFDSVQAFYKEFNAAKREDQEYEAACAEYEKTYEEKVADTKSVRERLRQKEQIVKIREADRAHQTRQKNKGAG